MSEGRAQHYIALSRLMTDQLDTADVEQLLNFATSFQGDPVITAPLVRAFRKWLEKEDASTSLRREFAHVFLLPGGVKPFESVYRGEETLLMREPWIQVKSFYAECGWQLNPDEMHPEDHVSVELAFMAHLISTSSTVTPGDDDRRFFLKHISRWVPELLSDMKTNRHSAFYRDVAEYGLAFLKTEEERYQS